MKNIISAAIGGVLVITLGVIFLCISESYNYKSVYIINSEVKCDSFNSRELETLKALENKGLLLNPNEYAGNIASYYNTLVSFLSVLFVIFSILGYFYIKLDSKKEIQKDVDLALKEMLRDSIKFKETILGSIYGEMQENFVDKEMFTNYIEDVDSKMEEVNSHIEKLESKTENSIEIQE